MRRSLNRFSRMDRRTDANEKRGVAADAVPVVVAAWVRGARISIPVQIRAGRPVAAPIRIV